MAEVTASDGIDWNRSLEKILDVYQGVSVARSNAAAVKYQSAAAQQVQSLYSPEGVNARGAYAIGNAGAMSPSTNSFGLTVPPALIYGGVVLAAGFLLIKAFK